MGRLRRGAGFCFANAVPGVHCIRTASPTSNEKKDAVFWMPCHRYTSRGAKILISLQPARVETAFSRHLRPLPSEAQKTGRRILVLLGYGSIDAIGRFGCA